MQKYWKILPLLALVVLYGGSIIYRPIIAGAESYFSALAMYQSKFGAGAIPAWNLAEYSNVALERVNLTVYQLLGGSAPALRILSLLAILASALLLYLRFDINSRTKGLIAALFFATTPVTFFAGTSLNAAAPTIFLAVLALFSLEKIMMLELAVFKRFIFGLLAVGAILGAVALGGWAVVLFFVMFALFSKFFTALGILVVVAVGALKSKGLPVFDYSMIPASVLLLGLMPWVLFVPIFINGSKHFFAEKRFLGNFISGIVMFVVAVICPEYFLLGSLLGVVSIGMAGAELINSALENEAGRGRFDRQIRSISIILCTALVGLVMLQSASKFVKVDANIVLYGANENWMMALFALAIPLMWWHLARKEVVAKTKVVAFAVGSAFLLLAGSSMIPAKVLVKYAPETLIRTHVLKLIKPNAKIVASPKFAPIMYRLTQSSNIALVPKSEDELKSVVDSSKGELLLILDGFVQSPSLPAAAERYWFKDAQLYVLAYEVER